MKERTEQTQSSGSSSQSVHDNEGANRRFLESMRKHEREHEERVRKLQKVKDNLPKDKERLDTDWLDKRLRGL